MIACRYRLITSAFLHLDLDHLLGNMSTLVVSECYVESRMSTQCFAATVLSLTASSQGLFGMSQGHVHVLHIMHQPSSTSYCLLANCSLDELAGVQMV